MKRYLFIALITVGGSCSAADNITSNNISFSGALVDMPACKINDGNILEVNFGDVGVNKVSEVPNELLRRGVFFDINCEGDRPDVFLRYLGTPTSFNSAAVQSTITDLGIQLSRAGDGQKPVPVGEGWLIKAESENTADFSFLAAPVKRKGAELEGGEFSATANLRLEFP
ncbi:fimbrial protein [Serratia sp. IR-2025]|uniref:fimbrial protein n=1 Tax=Serratia marcescens TaxID=615 RepID=UPI00387A1085